MFKSTIYFVVLFAIVIQQSQSFSINHDENTRSLGKPPRPTNHALVARDLLKKSTWASVGTISTAEVIKGFPMVNMISIADGIKDGKSTGVIYFLLTDLDFTGKDLLVQNKITFMISNDQDLSCTKNDIDPMEPTCARIHLTGSVIKMDKNFPDYNIGMDSMLKLHPASSKWLQAHHFNLCKLQIDNIYILDYYGPPKRITPNEYYTVY